jgi:hypothetical protein
MLQHATRRTMVQVLRPVARALVLAFLDYLRRVDEALGGMFSPPPGRSARNKILQDASARPCTLPATGLSAGVALLRSIIQVVTKHGCNQYI